VNEARSLLGLDPVPGGEQPLIYGAQGAVPLAIPNAVKASEATSFRKYNPDEPRIPVGNSDGGQWTTEGGGGGSDEAANGGNDRKSKCIEECLYLLDRPLPYRWSNLNQFAFRRCLDECMQAG